MTERTTYVDPSNAAAAATWDGPAGDVWAENADLFDGSAARYLPPFLAAAEIESGSHVLDVGCGAGRTTCEAARLAQEGTVTGVDLSSRLLELATRRAEQEGLATSVSSRPTPRSRISERGGTTG